MSTAPAHLLVVEDSPDDTELLAHALRRGGIACDITRVETQGQMTAALDAGHFDLVVTDYNLPRFSAHLALALLARRGSDVPVICVSGQAGEDVAVELMRAGARDFILKSDLARFAPAVSRELADARRRRERAAAEADLRALEVMRQREASLLHEIQDIARVGGWEMDLETRAVTWTEGIYRIFETTPAEFQPTFETIRDRMARDGRALVEALDQGPRGDTPRDIEFQIITLRGNHRWVRSVARPQRIGGVVGRVVGAMLDITDRKAIEEQLLLADRLAAMGTIAAGIAHELNNPLTYLIGALPPAIHTVDSAHAPELGETLRDCLAGAQRIAAIVRDLRVFSRTDASVTAECSLHEVVDTVLRMLNTEFKHRAQITRHLEPGLTVRASAGRIAQLLTNLVINAVQAMPERPVAENRVRIEAASAGADVTIDVIDNGSGVDASVRDRLFSPFATTKPVGVGTGLGLAVCLQIVSGLGGSIAVLDHAEPGTTFRVTLPRVQPEVSAAPEASPPADAIGGAAQAPAAAPRLGILIIDDEPLIRNIAARILRAHDVVAVASVDAAMTLIGERSFDAIVCDLMMPGRTGMEFHHELQLRAPHLVARCVFATGGAVTADARAFVATIPPGRLLEKPYDATGLKAAIQAVATTPAAI